MATNKSTLGSLIGDEGRIADIRCECYHYFVLAKKRTFRLLIGGSGSTKLYRCSKLKTAKSIVFVLPFTLIQTQIRQTL
jgi:hypothetical protein